MAYAKGRPVRAASDEHPKIRGLFSQSKAREE